MTIKKSQKGSPRKRTKYVSAGTVQVGSWLIKASCSEPGGVLIVMFKISNLECHTRFFEDQVKANLFVTEILERPQRG